MAWVMFRFVLLGPAVGSMVFVLAGAMMSPAGQTLPVPATPDAIGTSLFALLVVWIFGCVLAYPITGLPAAVCGLIYWMVLARATSNNFRWPVRLLIGGFVGLACAAAFGGGLFVQGDHGGVLAALIPWAVVGAVPGACSAVTVGRSVYSQAFPERTGHNIT